VFVGHFGSGKTEVALGVALAAVERGEQVTLVDLDLVKPFFRCRATAPRVASQGLRIIAPDGNGPPMETPVTPPDLSCLLHPDGSRLLIDAGGDPVGALLFGEAAGSLPRDEIELLLLLNFARPKTDSVEGAVAMARAIEAAARFPLAGLIANTNLLGDTTPEIVRDGLQLTRQTASVLGLPVSLLVVEERLTGAFPRDFAPCPILPIRRLVYPSFERPFAPRIAEVRPTRSVTIPTSLTVSGPVRSTLMLPAQPGKGA
jgi:hypothetical protein